jgi:two-component system CheB/CheR fusion protein
MSISPAENPDPAASDGARKLRDPEEPSAVVGLGASAGGIAVLQQFFGNMSPESGLAFVVVMHLSPEHESNLASIIQQKTTMLVTQVHESMKAQPNQVYVIPPNKQLAFEDGSLQLLEPQQATGRRVTIDLFFRTLGQAYGQRAVCIILSGTDSDGVIGLKHVRAQGGVTIAQDPKEAEYDSMPLSAIGTGMVDWVLPVAEMPSKLLEFVQNERRMQLPPEILEADTAEAEVHDAPGGETVARETRETEDENALREVLTILRRQTGHDFAHYKRATLLRRIARRMQVNSMAGIPEYLKFFRKHGAEAGELLHDLLIGVTHFFRDRASFAAFEANIPQLFAGKGKDGQIRVWVPGCATGEEAYSIAMLLCEHAERLDAPPSVQIFATDIDDRSIHEARHGVYPVTIEADVSPERLRRFFDRDHGRYRVRKHLREKVLFAAHNLLRDAPFSNLDLVSCRNLLIYLTPKAQETVFDTFHFSLRPGGLLFIGGSETGSTVQTLFSAVDAKHRLYVRRSVPRPSWKIPLVPARANESSRRAMVGPRLSALPALTPTAAVAAAETREPVGAGQERRAVLFGELHLKLLEQYGPPSIVVNASCDIVHLSEKAGRYLHFIAGEPTANLLKVVHPALQIELRTTIFRASQSKETIDAAPVAVELDGASELIRLRVRPSEGNDLDQGFYLVLFEKQSGSPPQAPPAAASPYDSVTRDLQAEIDVLKRQLNDTSEHYEAATEELKASNEELQAMNEEMRSATEEMETSKEELQSVNEELSTVNHELKSSVEELSRTNADLANLMASTDIGTIFLDRQLRIQRFTPSTQKVFNLIPADVGRPISDITHKLAYDDLMSDAKRVFDTLAPIESEVRLAGEQWFLVRIAPYRTGEDRIAGVVATFIDITARKRMELKLRESEARLRRAIEVETVAIIFFEIDGFITHTNEAFLRMSGYTRADVENRQIRREQLTPADWKERTQEAVDKLKKIGSFGTFEKQYQRKDGSRWWALVSATRLGSDGDAVAYILDISERKQTEEQLRASEIRFRAMFEQAHVGIAQIDKAGRFLAANPGYTALLGYSEKELRGMTIADVTHPDDLGKEEQLTHKLLAGEISDFTLEKRYRHKSGSSVWGNLTATRVHDPSGKPSYILKIIEGIGERKKSEEALRESEEKLRLLIDNTPDYAMFLLDTANRIIYWNKGAERVFGWTSDEALGKTGEIIFTPEDRAEEREEKEMAIARRDGVAPDRRYHVRKDGSRIWVDGIMRRLDDEQGELRGYAKIARDATEQRLAEEKLHRSRLELEARVVERTAELRAINRDLENEIKERSRLEQEILLISEREKRRIGQDLHDSLCQELAATAFLLESKAETLRKSHPEEAKTFSESAHTVNENVGLARDLARGLHPIELSSSGLVNALRELCYRTHQSKLECHFVCPKPVRVRDESVALNLYRIAQEAVGNALKHSKSKEIVVSLARNGKNLVLKIRDNGGGFGTSKPGSGLGIHIMKYRAASMGGELTVESKKGNGTTITCTVPSR